MQIPESSTTKVVSGSFELVTMTLLVGIMCTRPISSVLVAF